MPKPNTWLRIAGIVAVLAGTVGWVTLGTGVLWPVLIVAGVVGLARSFTERHREEETRD